MKIVQINSECGRGSTGKITKAISELLTKKNIENYVFYSGNHKSDYPLGIRINSKFDLRSHQILSRVFGDQGFHSSVATWNLVKKLKRINPDIIHLHNLHGYYLNLSILFKYLSDNDVKVVWTLHDCWAFTGHCTHFTICGCDKWKTQCCNCPQYHEYPYSIFFDRSRTLYNKKKKAFQSVKNLTIVTPSQWLADLAKESFLGKYDVRVINNGINLSVFKPTASNFREKYNCEEKYIILGVASVWSYKKGLDYFIQLSKELNNKYQIVLVGTDERIDKQLPSNIISIHRTTNQEELAGLYTTADVFINASMEETYPTVNMEAISCGTPVITFRIGGSPEIVNENTGIVISCGDINSMIKETIKICKKEIDLTNECIFSARDFEEKDRFNEYLELYMEVTKQGV